MGRAETLDIGRVFKYDHCFGGEEMRKENTRWGKRALWGSHHRDGDGGYYL